MMTAESVAQSLKKPTRSGKQWQACCPAHNDNNPSLSIVDAEDGKVLVNCHAGCTQEAVIEELKKLGAWTGAGEPPKPNGKRKVVAKYDYTNGDGRLVYQVVRYEPKDFRQRQSDGAGGWKWSMTGVERLPYHLPDLLAADGETVFVVEGEKDADALACHGLVATCNAGGAKNWRKELNKYFAGKTVVVIHDNDQAGREHAKVVASNLHGLASSVRVADLAKDNPDLAEKGDVSDWLTLGGDPLRLVNYCQSLPEWVANDNSEISELPDGKSLPRALPFILGDPSKIPPREFIYGRHYIRGFATATAGVGGVGKSTIIVAEAIAVATGKNLLGDVVTERCPVWYVNLEDPIDEIKHRVTAKAQHYDITGEQQENRLFLTSGRSAFFVIAEDVKDGVKIIASVVDAIALEIRAKGIGLVIIDPFVKAHRVSENANERIDAVITTFAEVAELTGACIELVPRLRKGIGERGSDDIRGASSFVGAVRFTRIVNVMTDKEASEAGIEDDPRRYLRVDDGKRNMSPPAGKRTWRRLASVGLGDATESQPSDSVGVAETWKWPDAFEDVNVEKLREVQRRVGDGEYRESAHAKDWVGHLVAEVLELDIEIIADKSKVKKILKTWLKNGALVKVEKAGEDRKVRPYVEAGKLA
jgi:5S rRNA maturation endonuclease (ribonuclease M5)